MAERDEIDRNVREIAAAATAELGLELVEVAVGRAKKRWRVRLDIDRVGATGVDLEDCRRVSEAVSRVLDERDAIPQAYVLEVSSPGVYRPIRTADDVRRNTGRRVVVETHEPLQGRRSFCGLLVGWDGETLRLREDRGEEVSIPWSGIAKARQEVAF